MTKIPSRVHGPSVSKVQANHEEARRRAKALAGAQGRAESDVSQGDYDQAKREVTGVSDLDHQQRILESIPESERWDPVPGSEGQRTREAPDEEEDDEGRNESAQLVDLGVIKAERELLRAAAEEADKKGAEEA